MIKSKKRKNQKNLKIAEKCKLHVIYQNRQIRKK